MPSARTAWPVSPACTWRTDPWIASRVSNPAAQRRCTARCAPASPCAVPPILGPAGLQQFGHLGRLPLTPCKSIAVTYSRAS